MLRAPFPWFGGKRRVADLVWERFGNVPNYVDPFCGSLAVPLARPHPARTETVNDKDCYVSNFWRAVTQDPEAIAYYADWPVNARHRWLVGQTEFREKMMTDPDFYDAKIAGWWVWGISQWIGSGWCSRPEWSGRTLPGRASRGVHSDGWKVRPNLTKRGNGTLNRTRDITESANWTKRPSLHRGKRGINQFASDKYLDRRMPDLGGNSGATGKGVLRSGMKMPGMKRAAGSGVLRSEFRPRQKRPLLLHSGTGITKQSLRQQLPQLSGDGSGNGRGVLSRNVNSRKGQWKTRPYLSAANGNGVQAVSENLVDYMLALRDRMRFMRVCCGNWNRILGPSPTTCIGVTAVFLDPPYSAEAERDPSIYNADDLLVAQEVAQWAREHGDDPKLRIALCGYEGEHVMPKNWTVTAWKANGGYGNQANCRGRENARRERIWFSPHCLHRQGVLL